MLDGNRRRQPVDLVDVRLLHHLQELARIGRQRFDIAALALGVNGIEGERRFSRARQPSEHHQPVARNFQIDVFKIVLARAANGYRAHARPRGLLAFRLDHFIHAGNSRCVARRVSGRASPENGGSGAKGCVRNVGRTRADFQCCAQSINGLLRGGSSRQQRGKNEDKKATGAGLFRLARPIFPRPVGTVPKRTNVWNKTGTWLSVMLYVDNPGNPGAAGIGERIGSVQGGPKGQSREIEGKIDARAGRWERKISAVNSRSGERRWREA